MKLPFQSARCPTPQKSTGLTLFSAEKSDLSSPATLTANPTNGDMLQHLWQVDIIIPVFNQLHYTRQCLESLRQHTPISARTIFVDNGSTDGTAEYLRGIQHLKVLRNSENLGCAAAWNQGVKASTSDWIVILNNDVLLTPGWLEGLLAAAKDGLDIVSPALREGPLNYELDSYALEFVRVAANMSRPNQPHGVCFLVHRGVFDAIGLFDENFRIGQFEDADFFQRAREAGFKLATAGRSFIHHFGSVTQNSLRSDNEVVSPYEGQNRAYFRQKWRLGWFRRHWQRMATNTQLARWRAQERRISGHSLHERWRDGQLFYH